MEYKQKFCEHSRNVKFYTDSEIQGNNAIMIYNNDVYYKSKQKGL